ncbi:MAG: GTPase Era [Chloroflexota bacterium]|nr:GTPase Era [Chloroflexota bacterium]
MDASELESVLDEGPLFDKELPPGHRSGFVALVGKPNVGKSTLLNAWMGTKLAPVSPKPQTTRDRLLGILTREDAQVLFMDTPGIHRPRTKLGDFMVEAARSVLPDADVVVFVIDLTVPPSRADRETAALLATLSPDVVRILAMNKMDRVSEEELENRCAAYEALSDFDHSLCISALLGKGVGELLQVIIVALPQGPRYYSEDQLTDRQERFIVAELIREHGMRHLHQEVPHALAVVVREMKKRPNGTMYILAHLYVEKESQKGIVIGKNASMLKAIGHDARIDLQRFLGGKVYLDLQVRVRKNWRRDKRALQQFGYTMGRQV